MPSAALAERIERNFLINSNGIQSFENLVQYAENFAKNSIDQEFTANPKATEVNLIILGEHQGQVVPLLRSTVSRSQWQQNFKMRSWTRYFASSAFLLGFRDTQPSQASKPQSRPRVRSRSRLENDPAFRDD
ncbi:hypothetical protein [Lyngbya aestuarii]|uniref:hypothetical protein n=1 Tax=Lyngbya aestuarii TaxID=118322 RepID=UPI00403D6E8E